MKCQAKLWPEQRAPKRSANPCRKASRKERERYAGRKRQLESVDRGSTVKSAEISWILSMEQIVAAS